MDDRRYVLNKKAFAATRALGSGADHDKKWDYMYVSPKGVVCTDTISLIRVSLPTQPNAPTAPAIFPLDLLNTVKPKAHDERVTMTEGLEAKSTGLHSVPSFDHAIPKPETEVTNITVQGKTLINLLKAACEVTDHSRQLIRLRICQVGKNKMLRIDSHRDEGEQEFTGILMSTQYDGVCIPGDKTGDTPAINPSENIDDTKLVLPMLEGRKFRD